MRLSIAIVVLYAATLAGFVAAAPALQNRPVPDRAKLVGLDSAEVEARIGAPTEKNELADSNEMFWIYRTKAGTLSVHFENGVVVDIDPADFPVETILK